MAGIKELRLEVALGLIDHSGVRRRFSRIHVLMIEMRVAFSSRIFMLPGERAGRARRVGKFECQHHPRSAQHRRTRKLPARTGQPL